MVRLRHIPAFGLAFALCMIGRGVAGQEPPQTPPNASVPADGTRGNWRARAVLESQRRAVAPAPAISGAEADVIFKKYLKSLGKGGAGANLSPRRGVISE